MPPDKLLMVIFPDKVVTNSFRRNHRQKATNPSWDSVSLILQVASSNYLLTSWLMSFYQHYELLVFESNNVSTRNIRHTLTQRQNLNVGSIKLELLTTLTVLTLRKILWQESPPAWTQEAYRPPRGHSNFLLFRGGGPLTKIFFPSLNMYQAKSGVKNFSLYSGGGGWGVGPLTKIFFPVWTCIKPNLVSKIFPFTVRGVGGWSLDKNFFSQSEHVSSQIWCQKFFPLQWGGGGVGPLTKICFPVWTCIKPNLVSKFFPFTGGEGGSLNNNFFSSLNMYQAKSGVKNFSLYWGGGGVPRQKFFFPVWTCIKWNLVSKIFPFTETGYPSPKKSETWGPPENQRPGTPPKIWDLGPPPPSKAGSGTPPEMWTDWNYYLPPSCGWRAVKMCLFWKQNEEITKHGFGWKMETYRESKEPNLVQNAT